MELKTSKGQVSLLYVKTFPKARTAIKFPRKKKDRNFEQYPHGFDHWLKILNFSYVSGTLVFIVVSSGVDNLELYTITFKSDGSWGVFLWRGSLNIIVTLDVRIVQFIWLSNTTQIFQYPNLDYVSYVFYFVLQMIYVNFFEYWVNLI